MNDSLALPPGLILRDFLLGLYHRRRMIFLIVLTIMIGAVQLALVLVPNYKARSTLLVLMGTEHAFRPAAGQQFLNSSNVDLEQILRTEASILQSDDLHRAVIRDIGLAQLYPKLLEPPGMVRKWLNTATATASEWLGPRSTAQDETPADPLAAAVEKFNRDLTIAVDRKSSVITLDFSHPDKVLAARALEVLEQHYFDLRKILYGDVQAPIVKVQRDVVGKELNAADAALENFKKTHDISSFTDRRTILLRQQGDLEAALLKAQATSAEQQAKVDMINSQLAAVVGTTKGNPNAATALKGMVDAYRRRESAVQNTYRGSTAADEAHRQMLARETDVAKMQSTQAFALQADRDKAAAELQASKAAYAAVKEQLTQINQKVSDLDSEETELHRLERNRGILEDNFKAVSKILDERQTMETVDASRQSSVRVVQPPRTPPYPQPIRKLIILAGALVSLVVAFIVALSSHFLRTVYFRREALELDTGLTVLASIPETRSLGRSALLIGPVTS